MSLEDCLPAELRGPSTTITRMAAGLSGAGVYRVESSGQVFVLKVAADGEPLADCAASFTSSSSLPARCWRLASYTWTKRGARS